MNGRIADGTYRFNMVIQLTCRRHNCDWQTWLSPHDDPEHIWLIRTGPKSHYPLVEQLESLGLHSAYHVAHDAQQGIDEAATHWNSNGNSYTIDHIFTPTDWPIADVTVGGEDPWRTRSDHAPVTVELGPTT